VTLTIAQALEQGAARLAPIAADMARREAGILLGHVLDMSVTQLFAQSGEEIAPEQFRRFDHLLQQREQHRPVSQLVGKRAFWEHEFVVTPNVLDPRPETELLVELALEHTQARRVLDLGTGSGCILCSVLRGLTEATGVGVDISQAALTVARTNAEALGVADRADFRRASWFDGVEGSFDLILSNPPYVTGDEYETLEPAVRNWEPRAALTDDGDGLAAYRVIAKHLEVYLAPGGVALLEHGWQQAARVAGLFREQGFRDVRSYSDLSGKDRVVGVAAKTPST
jgi:release factor glutamine methyltransferase